MIDEETVASPDVNNNFFVRSNEFLKSSTINLSDGATANLT